MRLRGRSQSGGASEHGPQSMGGASVLTSRAIHRLDGVSPHLPMSFAGGASVLTSRAIHRLDRVSPHRFRDSVRLRAPVGESILNGP